MLRSKEEKAILEPNRNSVGVVVARFQIDRLHTGQISLLKTVFAKHKTVIIFLGISPLRSDKHDPLDFIAREQMLRQTFPIEKLQQFDSHLIIDKISDNRDDHVWSRDLDKRIREVAPAGKITLYGSRESFLKYYDGSHNVVELEPTIFTSGTDIRQDICADVKADPMFRRGWIHGAGMRYDSGHPTIDVAIFKEELGKYKLLMGKRSVEYAWRFIGGHFDVNKDKSFEHTAKREAQEETSVEVDIVDYLGSTVIDDWKYSRSKDKIITTFFLTKYIFGSPDPRDDIDECGWLDPNELWNSRNLLVPEHHVLLDILHGKKPLLFS